MHPTPKDFGPPVRLFEQPKTPQNLAKTGYSNSLFVRLTLSPRKLRLLVKEGGGRCLHVPTV